ncbi:indolepyruvate ferredoxin oxidoreductase [Prauserella sp. PE36]|uniref:indolepyruvate ferredoxin oxidoreductase family protein n=1 Tax=Prauserella sp. PE36 TaxID=1504709 RepID=UPI000DE4840D|nr:indolepyruvate ferredoxin oxidoreductase family protein [Prauserella sp. PE36]RBM11617.1 indolepyruvate ferredoxin oxidoreductase [Prauserella sp. PE36]
MSVAATPERRSDGQWYRLEDRYTVGDTPVLLTGVQAIARALVEQRARDVARGHNAAMFVSGYQGSPLGGLDSLLASIPNLAQDHEIHLTPAVNEELAATAVWGTQLSLPGETRSVDGVVGIWYGKGPGLDRASDAIRHANMYGSDPHGGLVAFVGDDPSSKSSTLPFASDATLAALNMPFFSPRNGEEVVLHTLAAVELSRQTGCWVGVKILTDVADGVWTVARDFQALRFQPPSVTWEGRSWTYAQRPVTTPAQSLLVEADLHGPRWSAVESFLAANDFDGLQPASAAARFGIVGSGVAIDAAMQALQDLGLDARAAAAQGIRVLRVAAPHPLNRARIEEFSTGLERILVVEEKGPLIEHQVKDILYARAERPIVVGKKDVRGAVLVPAHGELVADRLYGPVARFLGNDVQLQRSTARRPLPLLPVQRVPYFCSGCPHNTSTVVPDGSIAAGGIGCHTLASISAREDSAITGWTQMGGEGAQWIGQARWSSHRHIFQNVGDGTFFHSGQLAVQAAVAAGVNITYKVLYNSAVAMTGAQDPQAGLPVPALADKLLAEGVRKIIVCADEPERYRRVRMPRGCVVWPRERLDEAQRTLREVEGVTALIYDQQCAANARRLRKRGKLTPRRTKVVINSDVCEGCGDCGVKSNCLSVQPVETEFGRKTTIDQTTCNTDYSCLQGDCPSFVTVKRADRAATAKARKPSTAPEAPEVLDPENVHRDTNIFLAGVGGTGIVTVNQILATAALKSGYQVVGLDQTGLSQKAGPVVSHLRLSTGEDAPTNRVSPGKADLILAFDLLVAADAKNALHADTGVTAVVASTSKTPTGDMVADPQVAYPEADFLLQRLRGNAKSVLGLDVLAVARQLFGSIESANLLLVGAAYQLGQLPVPAAAIEGAITLNGVAVEANIAAFRWGRAIAADPELVPTTPSAPRSAGSATIERRIETAGIQDEVKRLVAVRAPQLEAFQNSKLALGYIDAVANAWHAEQALGHRRDFSEAVARNLYKLLAYKDEYEVARLLTAPEFLESVQAEAGPGRVYYNLHPPILRAMGMGSKIQLGPWFRPAMRLLAKFKFVRGTWLDPFGYTVARRLERRLARDYSRHLKSLIAGLSTANYDLAHQIACLPDQIRGYEGVKAANATRYEAELQTLMAQWERSAKQ